MLGPSLGLHCALPTESVNSGSVMAVVTSAIISSMVNGYGLINPASRPSSSRSARQALPVVHDPLDTLCISGVDGIGCTDVTASLDGDFPRPGRPDLFGDGDRGDEPAAIHRPGTAKQLVVLVPKILVVAIASPCAQKTSMRLCSAQREHFGT